MSKVSYILTKGSITLHYEGKTKLVAKDDDRFGKVLDAIRANKLEGIPSIVEPELYFKKHGLNMDEGLLVVEGEAMPSELNNKIMEYKENDLPFQSLLKFWDNLKKNPSFNSRQQLFKFLENKGHSITEDGCFIGYRGVRDDFKDKHTGKFDNKPGSVCEMPRQAVDDNPNNTCSHGLHVGGYSYAKDFGPKLVIVKVNPKDVVAVPNDYNGQKMRVCKFEVLSEAQSIVETPVVNAKGGKDLQQLTTTLTVTKPAELAKSLLTNVAYRKAAMTPAEKRAHKRRYKNNYAKRGSNGKFVSKKKKK